MSGIVCVKSDCVYIFSYNPPEFSVVDLIKTIFSTHLVVRFSSSNRDRTQMRISFILLNSDMLIIEVVNWSKVFLKYLWINEEIRTKNMKLFTIIIFSQCKKFWSSPSVLLVVHTCQTPLYVSHIYLPPLLTIVCFPAWFPVTMEMPPCHNASVSLRILPKTFWKWCLVLPDNDREQDREQIKAKERAFNYCNIEQCWTQY